MRRLGIHQSAPANGRWLVVIEEVVGWTDEDNDGWIYPITAPPRVWRSRLSWNEAQRFARVAREELGKEVVYVDDKYPHEAQKEAA